MKIGNLVERIRTFDLVVPEFQREYIWSKEQAKELISSLRKGYPIGSLLFWETDKPPDLKGLRSLPHKLGTRCVILDGQQRLTALYVLLSGEIPPYYAEDGIENDPRDLYYDLDTGELRYYQASLMKENPLWRAVLSCFRDSSVPFFELAKAHSRTESEALALAQRYFENLHNLRQIEDTDLPVLTVPTRASVDEAIDIFDLVNSQGTKLTDAELALTHVTGKWPEARRRMKRKIDEMSSLGFQFDLTFTTRALATLVARRALFPSIHGRNRDELVEGWDTVEKILDYLVSILPHKAFIHSTQDLNTTNVLVPLIAHLSLTKRRFGSETTLRHAVHWLYAAHIWARYTSQTDQRLEHDVAIVFQEPTPWGSLRDQIIDQRGRLDVKADDLEGRGYQHPLHQMAYVLCKAHGAVDWFNGTLLGSAHGKAYRLHVHHIFPQAILYSSGYDPDNHLHRKIVNEIANRAFLTAESNAALSAKRPEDYLPEVERDYPGALSRQFVPMDPSLWRVERFQDFLEARRQLIARKLNEFMNALVSEPETHYQRRVQELASLGESATLEFKSTLRWDMVRGQVNRDLQFSALRTVAAFLNSYGGTLLVGVEDDGTVCGLGRDLATLPERSLDAFQQTLVSLMRDHIGPHFSALVHIRFEEVVGEVVCLLDVDAAPEPAFLSGPRGKEFFVRMGNTSQPLNPEETLKYVQMRSQ